MSEERHQVSIRAKSVLKLDTGQSNLDYTYTKDSTIDGMAKNIMHAVVFNKGVTDARAFFKDVLSGYDYGYRDPVPAEAVSSDAPCSHPEDKRASYHDESVKCDSCNCVIEQYGKPLAKPSPLSPKLY